MLKRDKKNIFEQTLGLLRDLLPFNKTDNDPMHMQSVKSNYMSNENSVTWCIS